MRILVKVDEVEGGTSIDCRFHKTPTSLLFQTIAYMIDKAFNSNIEAMQEFSKALPDVVDKYIEIMELQKSVNNITNEINDFVKNADKETIMDLMKKELEKPVEERRTEYFMMLNKALIEKELDEAGRTEEETTDSK